MINKLNVEIKIDKKRIYRRMHLNENLESYRCAEKYFDELSDKIKKSMNVTCIYKMINETLGNVIEETSFTINEYVLCFISSDDDIDNAVNEMISSGYYLKGYLLNEMAADVFFGCANQMNSIIADEAHKLGCRLTKRYAPGDGDLSFENLEKLLDELRKDININAYLTESGMIVPKKTMLYLFGILKDGSGCVETEESCLKCSSTECQYRK